MPKRPTLRARATNVACCRARILDGRARGVRRALAGRGPRCGRCARAADVDPALVYHYFGSKEGLLDAATNPPQRWLESVAKTWTTPVDELGGALLRLMLGAWADDEVGPVLRAVLQTAAHERVDPREAAQNRREQPDGRVSTRRRRARPVVRSGLISSQIMGLAMMRYVWKIEPVASMSDDEVVAAVAPNLQRYIEGELR